MKLSLIILLLASLIPVVFNACEGKMKLSEDFGRQSLSSVLFPDLECPQTSVVSKYKDSSSIFSKRKLVLRKPSSVNEKAQLNDEVFEEGKKFTAKIDNTCLLELKNKNLLFDFPKTSKNKVQYFNFSLDKEMSESELVSQINSEPCILGVSVQKKYITHSLEFNDPLFNEQNNHLDLMSANAAYLLMDEENYPYSGFSRPVVVAVVDTGVLGDHEDLSDVIWRNGDGDKEGFNLIRNQNAADYTDYVGHGTHVAGIIAASGNNNIGVMGVSPVNTQILAVKVKSNNSGGFSAEVANGIRTAYENGADVINLSIGVARVGDFLDASIYDEIQNAINNGVFVVASVGNIVPTNDGYSREVSLEGYHFEPASYSQDFDGMVSVGSTDALGGELSFFSHYSNEIVDITAPGANDPQNGIFSTHLVNDDDDNPGYNKLMGTSMSAPMVSAAAAVVKNVGLLKGKDLTPQEIQSYILMSSDNKLNLSDYIIQGRSLNLSRLYQMAHKCL